MKVIYKYPLMLTAFQPIELPDDAEILDIQIQRGEIVMWAAHNTQRGRNKIRRFGIFGTGREEVPDNAQYLATVQYDAYLVWHVYELFG